MHVTPGDEGRVTGFQACGRSVFWQVLAQYIINQLAGENQRTVVTGTAVFLHLVMFSFQNDSC